MSFIPILPQTFVKVPPERIHIYQNDGTSILRNR